MYHGQIVQIDIIDILSLLHLIVSLQYMGNKREQERMHDLRPSQ